MKKDIILAASITVLKWTEPRCHPLATGYYYVVCIKEKYSYQRYFSFLGTSYRYVGLFVLVMLAAKI